jgi:tRNA uridine 5-carbamoylmethylation protein Kti12
MKKELILIRGVSGAGKTTFARTLEFLVPDTEISRTKAVCADDYFYDDDGKYKFYPEGLSHAHAWCVLQVKDMMQSDLLNKTDSMLLVHNTFTESWEMERYEELAKEYGYKVTHIIVENRHGSGSVHDVPLEVRQRQKNRFDIQL